MTRHVASAHRAGWSKNCSLTVPFSSFAAARHGASSLHPVVSYSLRITFTLCHNLYCRMVITLRVSAVFVFLFTRLKFNLSSVPWCGTRGRTFSSAHKLWVGTAQPQVGTFSTERSRFLRHSRTADLRLRVL